MKKPILATALLIFTPVCFGGTAGPSDDEIFLLIIPLILFILYLGISGLIKIIRTRIHEWKEKQQLANHENGIANG